MPMDLGTRNTLLCDFMHCMTAVSLEMSDEPEKLKKITDTLGCIRVFLYLCQSYNKQILTNEGCIYSR